MISDNVIIDRSEFEQRTGWQIRPEGACKGDRCIPLPNPVSDTVDLTTISEHLSMPLISEPEAGLWALGPESGGKSLTSALAPELELAGLEGQVTPAHFAPREEGAADRMGLVVRLQNGPARVAGAAQRTLP